MQLPALCLGLMLTLGGLAGAQAGLPGGWTNEDIGGPAQVGSADYSNGVWIVSGGGAEICSRDQLQFAYRPMNGDGSIVAQVVNIENALNGQAGLMMRAETTNGAVEASVLATTNNGVTFQWRSAPGGGCAYQVVVGTTLSVPVWVSLARAGNSFSGHWSTNGIDYYQVGSTQTVVMSETAFVGLAVSATEENGLATGTFSNVSVSEPRFGLYRELWTGLNPAAGNSLAALTNSVYNPRWPNDPDTAYTGVIPDFETTTGSGLDYYGQRLRAFVVPPADGDYVFWIASDDTSALYLGADENPGPMNLLAGVSSATGPREWTREPGQQSVPIALKGGRRYFLEARMQQGTGTDHLAVRWKLPNGTYEEPMTGLAKSGTRFIPFTGLDTPPGLHQQPTNTVVFDGNDATFNLLATNRAPLAYQWRVNNTNLPGAEARTPVYTVLSAGTNNNNEIYTCVISNVAGAITSAPVALNVLVDMIPPTVVRAAYLGTNAVRITFSEPLETASATNQGNYVFTNGLPVTRAALNADLKSVDLTTGTLVFGSNYAIVLNNIRDRARTPNYIAANTLVPLLATPYIPDGVGSPTPPGTVFGQADGYDLGGGGRDIGSTSDQFQYFYQAQIGDFDVKVRLKSLSQTDPFAEAGLMARADLTTGSRFAAVLATPSLSGSSFVSRSTANGSAISSGSLPVNYPYTWLRLKRAGDVFSGYTSYDGISWQQLGTVNLPMPDPVLLGMAVASHNLGQAAVAQFRDIAAVTNAAAIVLSLPNEPAGPSSRRTGLTITEVMYHPAERADGRQLEFVEIFNPQPFFEDISGYSVSGDVAFTFPPGTILNAGATLVIARNPADVQAICGISNVVGPYTNNLSNTSGTVRLRGRHKEVLLEVHYDSQAPWPAAADGAGHSLVLARPSYGEGDYRAWAASDAKGGSPGQGDGVGYEPARGVVINEFLAHTDPPLRDAIELFNTASYPVDVSGCYLTDDVSENKFRIPDRTTIDARGYLAFDELQLGFRLDAGGETLLLVNAANSRVVDCVRFEGQANSVSSGRYPDGAPQIRPLSTRTPGGSNSVPVIPSVVINEIMYDPISGRVDDQFVELYNNLASPVDLSGWKFTAGISFAFRPGTVLPANSYLVVARNMSRMLTNYPNLNSANLAGNFDGSLAGRGERVALSRPDQVVSTNAHGLLVTNTIYIVENELVYGTGGRWGNFSDKGGSSLELIDPHADNSVAPNWADSDESAKAPWTTIETTGVLDLGNGNYPPNQLQMFLQGEGECLVDSVEVFVPGEGNRITNPNFDSSTAGWAFQGTQRLSGLDAANGYGGGPCLRVRASGRGDTGANRIRTALSTQLASGNTVTLRARVRWVKGNRDFLMRLRGNWLEATGLLLLPGNLGTPGARNSRYLANNGPAITEVAHYPILPAAGETVLVTARINDPDGLGSVSLNYRNDTASGGTLISTMTDDGAGADRFAGDGVYSAPIPGQASGTLVAFYVRAIDSAAAPKASSFPSDAPVRECLVRYGEPTIPGWFGIYRTWVTRANVNWWSSREKNSNEPLDATFVYGNFRVVYNMRTQYSGSPFHTGSYSGPTGAACDYELIFPDDEQMLGANDFVINTVGNLGSDGSAQREQAAFWMLGQLGVPTLHRRFVHMYVNGSKRGMILEDAQQPSSELAEQYFPDDSEGDLFKIEDWFEFDDTGSAFNNVDATLGNFTTTGGAKKVARYRWCWRPRAVQESSSDFTNLFALVNALYATRPEPYRAQVDSLMDVDGWMHTLALERFVGNWDSFGYNRGKNMYVYKPTKGPWQMMAWDIDFVLGLGDGATTGLTGGQDSAMNTLRNETPFARAYWRAFQNILDGPGLESRLGPVMDAKYNALVANGVPASSPAAIKSFLASRRSFVQGQLAAYAASFSVTGLTTLNNVATITGTSPVQIRTITFNGNEYPVTWTGVTTWSAAVPLAQGNNAFSVLGLDYQDNPVSGASNYVSTVYNGTVPSPAGQIAINEIMYDSPVPRSDFVELYNRSASYTYDLSGWKFDGLSYTFPSGSVLGPNSYLVLADNREAFSQAYSTLMPVFDTFGGALQADGELLTLIKPGLYPSNDLVVARVRYDAALPWPTNGATTGSSAQLVDAAQDNWRAANWATRIPGPVISQWVYVTATGNATGNTLMMYLRTAGDLYIDDIKMVAGSVPEAGANLVPNGDFESGWPGGWTVSSILAGSALSNSVKHGGNASLHLVSASAGSAQSTSIYRACSPALVNGQPYTLSFWYLQSTNGGPLVMRITSSGISVTVNPAPPALKTSTPALANSVTGTLPAFPQLWINEIQAENITGITNRAGQRKPWIEIYNPGAAAISLSGLYLANSYTNLTAWAFPGDATINAREFKAIFADGQTNLSIPTELHTGFTLAPGSGGVALSRLHNSQPQVLDYVNYSALPADRTYGSYPDGQSFYREQFYYPSPGRTNNNTSAPITVFINEWMADNSLILPDPADSDFEDWFELYNPSDFPADLGGFYLTDNLTNKFQYRIPTTGRYIIPPHGFLLVWADEETGQNDTNNPDLHADFKLGQSGEAIGLFATDGSPVDTVQFGAQLKDVSAGRYPDGSAAISFLPAATPGAPNPGPNTPPTLQSIPDQLIIVSQSATVLAMAGDNDAPAQLLTFSLAPGSPAGAAIDPVTGLFNWTPTAPGTNTITVTVKDNGAPNLSDSKSFVVRVQPQPRIEDVSAVGGEFSFRWMTLPGHNYQVEYKEDLNAPYWLPWGSPVAGDGQFANLTDAIAPNITARFFRIRLVE